MKKTFGKACLFIIATAFLFENAGFFTHQLNLAVGIVFLAALGVSYLPVRNKLLESWPLLLIGIVLMLLALAVMPGEFLRPGALALFLLGLYLVLRAFDRPAPELPLFGIVAVGYGLFFFLYRSDVHFWRLATGASFGFSHLVAALTQWLPGPKAQLGPSFLGLGTVVVTALLFVVGGFFLKANRGRKIAKALCSMAVLLAVYVLIFTYLPRALDFQLKAGPIPSEAEQSRVQQAQQAGRPLQTRTESEQATRVIFSADSLTEGNCPLWAPFLLVPLFLIPAYFFFQDAELKALPLVPNSPKRMAITGAAGLVLLLIMAYVETGPLRIDPAPNAEPQNTTPLQQAISEKRVAFYYHGFANWMRPSFRQYGSRSSGMFGNLPDFVEAMGFNQPLPVVNAEQAQYIRQRGGSVETRTLGGSDKSVLIARDELGYLNSGVLLSEITEKSLRDVDILMLLNIDDRLNSQNPPAPEAPSPALAARQAVIKKTEKVRDAIKKLLAEGDYTKAELAALAGLAAQPLPELAQLQQQTEAYATMLADTEGNEEQGAQNEIIRQRLVLAQDSQLALTAAAKTLEPLMQEIAALTKADPVTLEKLRDEAISLIAEQMEKPQRQAVERIRQFVARGGSLLVIGDHTFLKESDQPSGTPRPKLWLNEVLAPFEIKFNNDSAEFFIGGWLHSMQPPLHALTYGLEDDYNSVGMVVGASLKVTGSARPVIVGKYGFLDAGDMRDTRGFLGNLDFDMGERLGDVVIAAEQDYGKGKVLVFGDTSAFANGIITNTGGFVNRVFAWLAAEGGPAPLSQMPAGDIEPSSGWLKATIVAVLLIVGIAALVLSHSPVPVIAAVLAIGAFVSLHSGVPAVPLSSGQNDAIRMAYIDQYHMPQISKEGWRPNGTMGLHLNLMRNGFYSQNLDRFDLQTLRGADVVVSLSPTRPFSPQDVKIIRSYLETGGTFILTAGHEDLPCIRRLLKAFELRIPNTPLGRFRSPVTKAGGQNAPFWRVWPIESTTDADRPLGGELLLGPMETIIDYQPITSRETKRYNLGVRRSYGDGQFILIGDSGFWMNKNLEIEKLSELSEAEQEQYHDGIQFMKWMLETYVPRTKETE